MKEFHISSEKVHMEHEFYSCFSQIADQTLWITYILEYLAEGLDNIQ